MGPFIRGALHAEGLELWGQLRGGAQPPGALALAGPARAGAGQHGGFSPPGGVSATAVAVRPELLGGASGPRLGRHVRGGPKALGGSRLFEQAWRF